MKNGFPRVLVRQITKAPTVAQSFSAKRVLLSLFWVCHEPHNVVPNEFFFPTIWFALEHFILVLLAAIVFVFHFFECWFVSSCFTFLFFVTGFSWSFMWRLAFNTYMLALHYNCIENVWGCGRFRLSKYFTSGRWDTWCISSDVPINGGFFYQDIR